MNEALGAVLGRPVSRETCEALGHYVELLLAESRRQNLISAATAADVWERHIIDSAQLVRYAPRPDSSWVDIGSGAGLPGIVVAILTSGSITLVEPRRLRAEFLEQAVADLGLSDRVTTIRASAGAVVGNFDVITARAVAPLTRLLGITRHLSHPGTVWVLPKGRNANIELAEAQRSWQCEVRSEVSATDPQARILLLRGVRAKGGR